MIIHHKNIALIQEDTHISKWVIESGRLDHDQNMLPMLDEFLKPESTVIDIGAYIGDHSVYYAKRCAKVICFEPNPEAFECLVQNAKPNMMLFNLPLSDKTENVEIISPNNNIGMTYVQAGGDIKTRALDVFEFDPSFIKIDAEGFEMKILKGAKETIERCRPVMLIEINKPALERNGTSFDEVVSYLRTFGYICRNIYPEQGMSDQQFDIICLP